jgi:sterol desaturase/sphingolipid hydroxylase (fatty acid hydroxylase superfamily)
MDRVSGFRNHPLDGAIVIPLVIFLISAGFSTEFSGVLAVIQIVTGLFLHANVRWRLRPMHRVLITPEFHHWHHANEPAAINTNYSVFLPLWDIVFGTYYMPRDRRPQTYGISEHMPDGLIAQLRHPLRDVGNPLRVIVHPIRSIKGSWQTVRQLLRDIRRSTFRRRVRTI